MKELIKLIYVAITEWVRLEGDHRVSAGPTFFQGYKSFSLWLALLFSAIKYFFV